jgi:glycosyltransferase involved in cell wall biosynthesis
MSGTKEFKLSDFSQAALLKDAKENLERICIVIPTALETSTEAELASLLEVALEGKEQKVTCILVGSITNRPISKTLQNRSCDQIKLITIPPPEPGRYHGLAEVVESYQIYCWLKENRFEKVIFLDRHGIGYYSMVAKHQGLYFSDTDFCLAIVGPNDWQKIVSEDDTNDPEDLSCDFMERKCVSLADLSACRSRDIVDWMQKENWHFKDLPVIDQNPFEALSAVTKSAPVVLINEPTINDLALPLVSVCIPHFNRPQTLKQTLQSITLQDYPHFEIIIVDDGSSDPEAIAFLNELKDEVDGKPCRIVRQENAGCGAARNRAANLANGEYLFFMDDDNWAKQNEISTLVRVALKTDAKLVTCLEDLFSGNEAPAVDQVPDMTIVSLGPALSVNLFTSLAGDTNALLHRQTYLELGGYNTDSSFITKDWEFYTRVMLKGVKFELVPEPLLWYRNSGERLSTTYSRFSARRAVARNYQQFVSEGLHQFIIVAQGMAMKNWRLKSQINDHEKVIKSLAERYQNAEEKLSTRRRQIDELQSIADELKKEVSEAVMVLEKKRTELSVAKAALERTESTLFEKERVLEKSSADAENYKKELEALREELNAMRCSKSWKLTTPLRKFKSIATHR